METRKLCSMLFIAGLLVSACGLSQPQIATVIVPQIVQQTQIITAEVTRIVRETQVVIVETTRIVRVTIVVTPTPPAVSIVNVIQGITLQLSRVQATATRLSSGRILLVGGSKAPDEFLAEVDVIDPVTSIITRSTPLHTARHGHTATLLSDGRVLVIGGYNLPRQWLDDAEVYDPANDTWTVVPMQYSHGVGHTATLMKDGRVLVVGGAVRSGPGTERVEIFDPRTNSWSEVMPLQSDRASHTAQLLDDGRVLVAGGGGGSGIPVGGDALLYDPQTNSWTATGPMVNPRIFGQSVRLSDGRVLVAGGINLEDSLKSGLNRKMSTSAEIYNPASNTWTATADLSQARYAHNLVLLLDGRVLASGGARDWDTSFTDNSFVREIEIYDPAVNLWSTAGELPQPSANAAGVLLPDGRVWVIGGQAGQSGAMYLSNTWLITSNSTQP